MALIQKLTVKKAREHDREKVMAAFEKHGCTSLEVASADSEGKSQTVPSVTIDSACVVIAAQPLVGDDEIFYAGFLDYSDQNYREGSSYFVLPNLPSHELDRLDPESGPSQPSLSLVNEGGSIVIRCDNIDSNCAAYLFFPETNSTYQLSGSDSKSHPYKAGEDAALIFANWGSDGKTTYRGGYFEVPAEGDSLAYSLEKSGKLLNSNQAFLQQSGEDVRQSGSEIGP